MYFRRVFVGLDLELRDLSSDEFVPPLTRQLVERGLEVAAAQRGELQFCAVIDGLDLTRTPTTPQQISAFAGMLSERLDGLADEAREAGIDCETSLLGGTAWQELLREADEWSADLMLVGSRPQPSPLGATALKLLHSATCPVLVERVGQGAASNEDEGEPLHVLIANDLSDAGGEMLMTLVGSGLWRDAKCWLTNIVEPERWPEAWRVGVSDEELARRQAARAESARLKLHEQLSPTDHRTMTYGILTHVAEGVFSITLRQLIDEWKIDLLVCGSGRRMDALIPQVPCSLLVFPDLRQMY